MIVRSWLGFICRTHAIRYVGLGALAVMLAACADGPDSATERRRVVERLVFEGGSMSPTLENGDVVDVLDYGDELARRGDVVAFRSPVVPSRTAIKRIIAIPGDVLEIDDRGLTKLSGELLDEPYVRQPTQCTVQCRWTIPEAGTAESEAACGSTACYFVMGDNRPNSADSRHGWLVPAENIVGWVEVD